jgi:hypothetical protein
MPFSYLNLKKIDLGSKELFRIKNPVTVTAQRISHKASCQPHLLVPANVAVCGSTVYKVILPGISISRTRNPPEEWLPRKWQFTVTLDIR